MFYILKTIVDNSERMFENVRMSDYRIYISTNSILVKSNLKYILVNCIIVKI